MRRSIRLFILVVLIVGHARGEEPRAKSAPLPAHTRQLLVVQSAAWSATSGALVRYERSAGEPWVAVGAKVPVSLGRHGMGWGRGVHSASGSGPVKQEGDGRSPAGVFPLLRAFGVAKTLAGNPHDYPYLPTLPSTYCVEDTRSAFYNQIIDARNVKRTSWRRWSQLRREDGLFDWAIVIGQNAPDAVVGAGSCVFLHLWRGEGRTTAGCTAMARKRLEEILRWLDPDAFPLLVQLPDAAYQERRADWALP